MHLYTRFPSVSTQLAPLLGELERRVTEHTDELSALLSECQAGYFSTRKPLLVNRLTEETRGLDPARTELVELVRTAVPDLSIAHLWIRDTHQLYLSKTTFHRQVRPTPQVVRLWRRFSLVRNLLLPPASGLNYANSQYTAFWCVRRYPSKISGVQAHCNLFVERLGPTSPTLKCSHQT